MASLATDGRAYRLYQQQRRSIMAQADVDFFKARFTQILIDQATAIYQWDFCQVLLVATNRRIKYEESRLAVSAGQSREHS